MYGPKQNLTQAYENPVEHFIPFDFPNWKDFLFEKEPKKAIDAILKPVRKAWISFDEYLNDDENKWTPTSCRCTNFSIKQRDSNP